MISKESFHLSPVGTSIMNHKVISLLSCIVLLHMYASLCQCILFLHGFYANDITMYVPLWDVRLLFTVMNLPSNGSVFFLVDRLFQSSFRLTEKLRRYYREFPYTPSPQLTVFNILH